MTIWLAKNGHQTSLTCLYCGFSLMNIILSWFSFRFEALGYFSISSLHCALGHSYNQRWWQSVQLVRRRGAIMADGYNILFKCDDKNWTFFWVGNINTTKQSQSRHFGETRLETGDFLVSSVYDETFIMSDYMMMLYHICCPAACFLHLCECLVCSIPTHFTRYLTN